ncbi:hypothetical protein T484DRAFT_1900328 [Baffinella frigidus]|nr:hypothetical protein T484DRAFT_1900328 [Cryptophyta sp. CCMP2293]
MSGGGKGGGGAKVEGLQPLQRLTLLSSDISGLVDYQGSVPHAHQEATVEEVDLRREEADPLQINHLIIQPVALQLSADFLASAAQRGGPDAEPDASGERGELPQRALKVSEISWLQRISLSGQFYGMRAEPVTLRVIHGRAPDDPDAPYGAHTLTLEPEPGSATGLSFLPETSQEGHAQLRRLAESYIAHHLTLDVWDADSGFALGTVLVSGLHRALRQGLPAVQFWDICGMLPGQLPDGVLEGRKLPKGRTREVQIGTLSEHGGLALRVVSVGRDGKKAHTIQLGMDIAAHSRFLPKS